MKLDESSGFIDATKASTFPCRRWHDIITYKRRKLCQMMKMPHQILPSDEALVADGQARVVHNWRYVIEQIMQSIGLDCDSGVHRCIEMALSHGPVGFSEKMKNEDKLVKEQKEVMSYESEIWIKDQVGVSCITTKCQNVLFDVLTSQKFALLCDLLCKSFQGGHTKIVADLSFVISKMKDGDYNQSLELFDQDIRLVWENFQKLGREVACMASNLLTSSQSSCQKQIVPKENSGNFDSSSQLTCGTEHSTKEEQTDSSYLDKISICKQCSLEARGKDCLICDGCEAMFHVTCIKPAVEEINIGNWYCTACSEKRKPSEPGMTASHLNARHHNCVVCRRLDDLESQGYFDKPEVGFGVSSSRNCSVSDMEDDSLEPSRTAILHLCKQCGTCEEENKRFMICSNPECFYKYYHIQCLKYSQTASQHQPPNRWYCPSCLCRACLTDRDDDLICICDGCDEGYHIYCMNPPRDSIPGGKWYCFNCNFLRIKKRMRMFEQSVLRKHGQDVGKLVNGVKGSMDMLVNAAEKLGAEEKLVKTVGRGR